MICNEPVADILRGVLDGHVVLDRKIAERGRFPAIDLLRSVSRALPGNTTLIGGPVWFNGLGEPIDPTTGDPLATNVTFSIGSAGKITVCQETGYVKEGTSCP